MKLRISYEQDLEQILDVHAAAFGGTKGEEIARLVNELLGDTTALPLLSMVAIVNNSIVGHIIFSKVKLINSVAVEQYVLLMKILQKLNECMQKAKLRELELNYYPN